MSRAQILTNCRLVYDGTDELQLIDVQVTEIAAGFERTTHLTFEVGDWTNMSFREYTDQIKVDL
jgi:hypothetical protein